MRTRELIAPVAVPRPRPTPAPAVPALTTPALTTPAPTTTRTTAGVCPGSLGELWQGPVPYLGEPEIGLVTLPAPLYSRSTFSTGAPAGDGDAVTPKRAAAIEAFTDAYRVEVPEGAWSFDTQLRTSAGMASSTADIVATLRCLYRLFDLPYDEVMVRATLRDIERSDPVFMRSPSVYLSQKQVAVRRFATSVDFSICFAVLPAAVETDSFGRDRLLEAYARHHAEYEASLARVHTALAAGDAAALAREATRSSRLAQDYLPYPLVEDLLEHHRALGAAGVARAHTGSLACLLYVGETDPHHLEAASEFFAERGLTCTFIRGGF